jgi:hypothetical protein
MSEYDIKTFLKTTGLTQIAELDEKDLSYEFCMIRAWLHGDTGRVFWKQDSGCSCPSPFEDDNFNTPDDNTLNEVKRETWVNLETEVKAFKADQQDKTKFLDAIKAQLPAKLRKVIR